MSPRDTQSTHRTHGDVLTAISDGMGLPLISASAAAVEVRAIAQGGTELVMRFDLAA